MLFDHLACSSVPSSPSSSSPSTWVSSSSPPSSPGLGTFSLDNTQEDDHELTRQTRPADPFAGSYNANKVAYLAAEVSSFGNKRRRVRFNEPQRATETADDELLKPGENKEPTREDREKFMWEEGGLHVFNAVDGKVDMMGRNLTTISQSFLMDISKMVFLPTQAHVLNEERSRPPFPKAVNARRTFTRTQTEPLYAGTSHSSDSQGKSLSSDSLSNPSSLEFFFANNSIRTLPSELWLLSKLTVLSLRNNNISYLPPEIEQLESLVELNVARNHLKYVPAELTRMKSLKKLVLFPNPFKNPPPAGRGRPISETMLQGSRVPRLVELLLRFLVSRPTLTEFGATYKTNLEEYAILPLATGHDHRPIPPPLAYTLANCVPGSITVHEDFVQEFDDNNEPKFVTGVGRCLNPRHGESRPVFVHHVEVRYTWETSIAGIDLGMPAPLRWRGCSHGCLDFLETTTEDDARSEASRRMSEDGEVVQTVDFDARPLSFDD